MAKSSKTKSAKKRVKVKDLPTEAIELTKNEAKKVKGGILIALFLPTAKAPSQQQGQGERFTNTILDDEAARKP